MLCFHRHIGGKSSRDYSGIFFFIVFSLSDGAYMCRCVFFFREKSKAVVFFVFLSFITKEKKMNMNHNARTGGSQNPMMA